MNQIAKRDVRVRDVEPARERRLGRLAAQAPIAGVVIAMVLVAAGGLALAVRASRERRFFRRVRSFTRHITAA